MNSDSQNQPVAVVGMALRVPAAVTPGRFWGNLLDGRDCLTRFSENELRRAGVGRKRLSNPDYVRVKPILDDIEHFDAAFFDMSRFEAEHTDPSHRLFLECVWEGLEDASIVPGRNGPVTSVFGGCEGSYRSDVLDPLNEGNEDPAVSIPMRLGNSLDFFTARVSHKLDLVGSSFTVMAACATSLVAVHLAVQSLRRGECSVAVAGGATIDVPHRCGYLGGVEGMLSSAGRIRPFDAAADGTVFGSGVGVVVLRPLDDALAEGNPIYAIIRGSASTNDGNPAGKESFIAPSPEGQTAAIIGALEDGGVGAETIGYLEAHGTGTLLGDPVEVASLQEVYQRHTERTQYCSLGSVKANVGHLRCAAGVVSLIKACMALQHRVLPPLANFDRPNPRIDFDSSPFFVHAEPRRWLESPHPRRAGVSAFGFGGSNVHVILEEYQRSAAAASSRRQHLYAVSAQSEPALERRIADLDVYLAQHDDLPKADVANTLQCGRRALAHRACFYVDEEEPSPADLYSATPLASGAVGSPDLSTVFLFPGQGSQRPGMGAGLYASEALYRDIVDECAEALPPQFSYDLRELLGYGEYSAPEGEMAALLRRTAAAQPALFVVEYAMARLFMSWGLTPAAMLGHSIGELVAACLAGVFSLSDGLRMVAARAELMQQCEPGSMAAVFIAASELEAMLPEKLELAAANAPAISVVSGPSDLVEIFTESLAEADIGSRHLETSHAFHSWMMEPVLPKFADLVGKINLGAPRIPVISNATGLPLTEREATDPHYWSEHVRRTVRFSDGLQYLLHTKEHVFIELGPGSTLTDLVRHHGTETRVCSAQGGKSSDDEQRSALGALGRMWCEGVDIDWRSYYGTERRPMLHLPTYPFQRLRHWREGDDEQSEPNAGDSLVEVGWDEAPINDADHVEDERPWLMFGDDRGLADAIVEKLRSEKKKVIWLLPGTSFDRIDAHTFSARPGSREDIYQALAKAMAVDGGQVPRVLHLWSVTGSSGLHNSADAFRQSSKPGFYTLVALTQAAFEHGISDRLDILVVVDGLARLVGEEGQLHAEKAVLLGACRGIPLEMPGLSMRCVDIPRCDDATASWLAESIVREAHTRSDARFVALRPVGRFAEQLYTLPPLPQSGPRLRDSGVVLITGGTGGIGLKFAAEMYELCRARLVLTCRWQPPPEAEWAERAGRDDKIGRSLKAVLALRARGAEVLVVKADAADPVSLAHAVVAAQSHFGAINGVVHAAGVIDPDLVMHKTPESMEHVFSAKVHGAFYLEEIFSESPLDIYIYLSSQASVIPERGQADYSGANAVLDVLARERARRFRGLSCATGWGPWREVGVAVKQFVDEVDSGLQSHSDDLLHAGAEDVDHPVLSSRQRQSDNGFVYRGLLHNGQWIVDEHLFNGRPLLSGTTTIELVRAAFVDHMQQPGCVELRRVALERPLFIDGDGAEMEIRFAPAATGERFEVRSRAHNTRQDWIVNATGLADRIHSAPTTVLESPSGSAQPVFVGDRVTGGPRWHCFQSMTTRGTTSWAHLKLADEFLSDLDIYRLHPALMDGPGMMTWRYTQVESVPYTYDAIRMYDKLSAEILIQARHRKAGSSDVSDLILADTSGRTLVEIDGHVVRSIENAKLEQFAAPEPDRIRERSVGALLTPRRVVVSDPGDLDSMRLGEFTPRAPGAGEVQIEIFATGLNFRDVLAALGQMPDIEDGPLAPGGECSGIVHAVGEGVRHLAPGDKVVAVAPSTLGTHTTTRVDAVASMPDDLDFDQAAGIPIVFLTAYHALVKLAQLGKGERILIHAAAGGVGLAAVQFARVAGAEIFATAGHPDKREYLRSLGVDHVMDSRSLSFVEETNEATAGEGIDVVLNSLAGEFIPASLGLLRSHGRFLEIGKRDIYADTRLGLYPFRNNLSYHAIDLGKMVEERNPLVPRMFDHLMDQFARGDLEPLPTEVIPIRKAVEGFRRMARAEHIGKIVFQVREDSADSAAERLFRENYGKGVTVEWGLSVLRRLLSSDETPPYVLATGRPLQGVHASESRPRTSAAGDRGRPDLDSTYKAPSSEVEQSLTRLWEKTLDINPIGIDDDFFDLGGDSIEAIQIQHAINRQFDLGLKNTVFLDNPTIGDLARLIEQA